MNRSSSNNHNDLSLNANQQHDTSLNQNNNNNLNNNNNNSFQDYLQSSAHNLSFTNLHQTSFEMEDAHPNHQSHNMPHSPVNPSSNYIPQSFLSKPFEDNNYDQVDQKSSWKFNWANPQNVSQQIGNTPLARNSHHQKGESLWDNAFMNENQNRNNHNNNNNNNGLLNGDLDIQSSQVIHSFNGILNESMIFNDLKGTPLHRNNHSSLSRHHARQNSQQDINNFGMDMEDEFLNPNKYHSINANRSNSNNNHNNDHHNNNQMDIEGSNVFDQTGTPTLYKKEQHDIVMNYDDYQQNMKQSDQRNSFDPIVSASIQSNNRKSYNYLFNNANNDHLSHDFKFSPIKPNKNIPFVLTPNYFADKHQDSTAFPNYHPSAQIDENDFSQKNHPQSPNLQSMSSQSSAQPAAPAQSSNIEQNNNEGNKINANSTSNANDQNEQANPAAPIKTNNSQCVCNCKKTKCLKLYCECFAKLGYCGEGCHCHECKNREEFEDERQNAITEARQRNHEAFIQKNTTTEQEQIENNKRKATNEQLKKGCNCRKTKCLKKYCECFNAGAYCNNNCKCESCENHPRNAALILAKKNAQGGSMSSQIIQHHVQHHQPIDICPPSLVVSSNYNHHYNQPDYYQNPYAYPSALTSLHNSNPHNNNHNNNNINHNNNNNNINNNQLNMNMNSLSSQTNHYLNSSSIYKTNSQYQARLLFDDANDDSDPINNSGKSKQDKKYFINKLRKQKKPIIKNRREIPEYSDEDEENQSSQSSQLYQQKLKQQHQQQQLSQQHQNQQYSQQQQNQQNVKLLRTKRGKEQQQDNLTSNLSLSDEEMQQQQKILDMEKKLKQIQQVQLLLQQQQLLKQKQLQLLNSHSSPIKKSEFPSSDLINTTETNTTAATTNTLQADQQKFISPPSNNHSQNEFREETNGGVASEENEIDEEIDQELKNQDNNTINNSNKVISNGNNIKKNKKKSLKKKDHSQLSEEKKQQKLYPNINNLNLNNNPDQTNQKRYVQFDEEQESYVSSYSMSQISSQTQINNNAQPSLIAGKQLRNRLNSENYEYIRKKSIQNCSQLSSISNIPTKCSNNLFNPTSYVRQFEDNSTSTNPIFPYQPQRIKKNSAHFIKAP